MTSLLVVSIIGGALFTVAVVTARRHHRPLDPERSLRRRLAMARQGLAVLRSPLPALGAILLQCAGWFMQLLAVYVAMRAFDIRAADPGRALVLLLMNVATIFPLWPGNIGLLQAAVALPLVQYGVPYSTGFAYGLVLQVIEMSVGVGVGLIFLAREGLSFASLREMPDASEAAHGGRRRPILPRGGVRALACPASLKASSRLRRRPLRWGRACAQAAPTRSSSRSRTAGRGRPRCSGWPGAASGARPTFTTPSERRGVRAGSSFPRKRRSSRPRLRCRSTTRLEPLASIEPRLR